MSSVLLKIIYTTQKIKQKQQVIFYTIFLYCLTLGWWWYSKCNAKMNFRNYINSMLCFLKPIPTRTHNNQIMFLADLEPQQKIF